MPCHHSKASLAALGISLGLLLSGCSQPPAQQASSPGQASPSPAPQASGQVFTLEEIKAVALAHAQVSPSEADFQKLVEETENGRKVYQLEFQTDSGLYEYEIDGATAQILSSQWEALPEASGAESLTQEEAKALVLARVPGATAADFQEFQQDYEDGRLVYEGELVTNGMEYEFEIDGATGEFLSWEEEAAHR